jgi:hypothetical protein
MWALVIVMIAVGGTAPPANQAGTAISQLRIGDYPSPETCKVGGETAYNNFSATAPAEVRYYCVQLPK